MLKNPQAGVPRGNVAGPHPHHSRAVEFLGFPRPAMLGFRKVTAPPALSGHLPYGEEQSNHASEANFAYTVS